jgi:hypothetical protein
MKEQVAVKTWSFETSSVLEIGKEVGITESRRGWNERKRG